MNTTYHVAAQRTVGSEQRHTAEYYLTPDGRWTSNVQNAFIFSRDGAIHRAQILTTEGTTAYPVQLTRTGQVRRVHVRPSFVAQS